MKFAQKSGRFLTVYQNRRYDGDFQAIRELVAAGTLGRIVRFETNYDRFRPNLKPNAWREQQVPGAGILFDIGPHLIDHAMVLFGRPKRSPPTFASSAKGGLADDAFDIMFHYPNSMRAVLSSNILAATQRPRFLLFGTKGAFLKQTVRSAGNESASRPNSQRGAVGRRARRKLGPAHAFRTARTQRNAASLRPPATTATTTPTSATSSLGEAEPAVTLPHALDVMRALEVCRAKATPSSARSPGRRRSPRTLSTAERR